MKSETNRPINIEDLLRLKRAERPPSEFWADFDRALRAKQLAALVTKRPWWRNLPRTIAAFSRYRVPLGASAILALTVFSFRDHKLTSTHQPPEREVGVPAVSSAQNTTDSERPVPTSETALAGQSITSSVAQPDTTIAVPVVLGTIGATVTEISHVLAPDDGSEAASATAPQAQSQRYSEAGLVVAQVPERLRNHGLLSGANGFESRETPARIAIEPLQQMSLPSDTRRSRLLTAMVSTASLESTGRTAERAANRIPEERLYDQVHFRFGAKADRLQVKF